MGGNCIIVRGLWCGFSLARTWTSVSRTAASDYPDPIQCLDKKTPTPTLPLPSGGTLGGKGILANPVSRGFLWEFTSHILKEVAFFLTRAGSLLIFPGEKKNLLPPCPEPPLYMTPAPIFSFQQWGTMGLGSVFCMFSLRTYFSSLKIYRVLTASQSGCDQKFPTERFLLWTTVFCRISLNRNCNLHLFLLVSLFSLKSQWFNASLCVKHFSDTKNAIQEIAHDNWKK